MAATPKCPNCQALNNFESIPIKVRNHTVELVSIQCANCGTVVGIMDYHSISVLIYKLAQKLKIDLNSPY
ncbi:hypothetical protein [Microcoleus sp. S28C3]|uniref:hypothetical protein n=1 Tax=Microcoleus sp. S28C3 TaxID=3055414 RepID=UPI002FD5C1F0